jgi:GNAT superfamily N-acetyltransferase
MRLATVDDVPGLVELLRACVSAMRESGIDQWDDAYPTESVIRRDIAAQSMYVALAGDAVAGVVVLNEFQDSQYADVSWQFEGERIGVVHRLMVDPRVQGRGFARDIMGFIERRAAEVGYDVLRLDAFSQNPRALRLYEALGYRDAGPMTLRKGVFRGFEKRLRRGA